MRRFLFAVVLLCVGVASAQADSKAAVPTYAHDIAPILNAQCVACHHQDGPAPFSLTTYDQARSHASQIAQVTRTRYMPPWLPDAQLNHFVDQLQLNQLQIDMLAAWARAKAPAGDLAAAPVAPAFADGWQLGPPDMVLTASSAWTMPASSVDQYRNFVFRVPIQMARFVRAVEIRPGNTRIVHHANVLLDTKHVSRAHDGEDGQPGFPGMDIALESDAFEPDSHFIYWKPGAVVWSEPPGLSWQLDPGTDLVLNMHLQASGKAGKIQPSLGLYFTGDAPKLHPMLLQLDADEQLDIPAGAQDFAVHDDFTLPIDCDVLAIYPHAHYLGHALDTYATLPDGTRQWLEKISQWDQAWQGIYRYEKPIHLPRGTVVSMRFTYDNTAGNPRNPSQPPRRVTAGNSSTDEMAHVWLQILPTPPQVDGEDARLLLQKAVMEHTLNKRPRDFSAHFNLAALALAQGNAAQAEQQLQQALAIQPNSAAALNSLGAALRQQGKDADAVTKFRQAIADDPNYADAHFNLAMELGSAGDFATAIPEFQRVLALNPNDADAEANLGAAYAQQEDWLAAEPHLSRALALDPQNRNAQANLEVVRQHTAPPVP